ncbi:cold-shock protein [Sinomonas terrae]|uniref:cold-shock protein n=1 Tax=Sinomonas terrae TaxID=2908838 RepID=UPI00355701B3
MNAGRSEFVQDRAVGVSAAFHGRPHPGTPPERNTRQSTSRVKVCKDGPIDPDDSWAEAFAHYSEIDAPGFRSLHEGQKVEYEVGHGHKGPQAQKIRPRPRESACRVLAGGHTSSSAPGLSRSGESSTADCGRERCPAGLALIHRSAAVPE